MNIYNIDFKVYHSFPAYELPFKVHPSMIKEGNLVKGIHSVVMEMTEEELAKMEEHTYRQGDLKIIGTTTLNNNPL